ncbi:hypothetical protein LshimejAT787_5300010 [Lyophyllum shimeji]|uniref:Uncharacterized protein n=1 Tax=Lyophyllum shimeji TaxID=47721 RepID=A0A9P3UVC4_LYOSH|nr:hypothetical protein LshimejAT787_5300010 [Lyophyllum shimeji]
MAGRTISDRVKAQKKRREVNARYQAAVEEYNRQQFKPEGTRLGLRPIAIKHTVNYKTLGNLAKGNRSLSAFNASKKKLTDQEERVMVDGILESAD